MTDNGSGQPQRFCTTCGTETRSNTQFCVNCGAGLTHQESIVADTSQADSADESLTSDQPKSAPPSQPMQDKGERDREDSGFDNGATLSPRTVYMKYDLYRQFFREARSGLVRFAGHLKQEGVEVDQTGSITYDDIVPSLLHAQVGFNKVEEYAKVLTTPLPDENVMRQALPMLSDLQQKQEQLLGLLEDFSRKLRSVEGQEHFSSEFLDWYMKLRTYAGKKVSQEGSPNKASTFIQWFRDLPSIPKIIIAGLIALVALILLSPVVRIIAVLALIVSVIVLIVRAIQREPLRNWGILTVASIFAVVLFSSIASTIYNSEDTTSPNGSNEVAGTVNPDAADTLSESEKEYIEQRVEVFTPMVSLTDRQIQLYNFCLEVCDPQSYMERLENMDISSNLLYDAQNLTPPYEYEESHERFLSSMEIKHEINTRIAMEMIGGSEIDYLVNESSQELVNEFAAMPSDGASYHDEYRTEFLTDNPEY